MHAKERNIIATCAGLLLAMIVGAPVVADDTELLLVTPSTSQELEPNILFIIDTSASMESVEETIEPYDSTLSNAGDCGIDRVYWSTIETVPVCDAANTNYIEQSSFVCDDANQRMAGIGGYSGVGVQYRPDLSGGAAKWQYLAAGFNTEIVECEADSGIHGDGTAGLVYAAKSAGLADPFTDDPSEEVSWGSSPRNQNYAFYDGNYLNWKSNPVTVNLQRLDIVKAVITAVLQSITNVNVGIMRFYGELGGNDGGPVIKALSDLDTDRASILAIIDSLDADGATPLAETMHEAALYWRGLPAHYGEKRNDVIPTDPAALDSIGPQVYAQPEINVCSKNYNVLLTDGLPVSDTEAQRFAPLLPEFQTGLGRTACDGTVEQGMCLDDLTEYLGTIDIDSTQSGDQFVTTHTIGFAVDSPILRNSAEISGGRYFLADEVESLTKVLLDIVADITARDLSFAAPAVAVNAFNQTQNLNDLYLTVFSPRARIHWPGNVKKFQFSNGEIVDENGLGAVNPATGFLDDNAVSFWGTGAADGNVVTAGGAANELPAPISRNLYTNNGADTDLTAANNAITPSNAGAFTLADFGLTGGAGEPSKDEMIRWLRGEDIADFDSDPSTTVRNQMGDPLHSQPAAIVYGGTQQNPDVVVFAATNDGYLHAIDGDTGVELWSFIPKELLGNMSSFFFDARSKYKRYGIDGNIVPVVADRNNNGIIDGADFVYILFGLRRGGNTLFALDVTDKNAPRLLWNVSYPQFGQSWSSPVVTRVDINVAGLNADQAVVVVGGGYDPIHDSSTNPSVPDAEGAGIHMLDLVSGTQLWRAGSDAGADLQLPSMTRSIPTQIRVVDMSGDGLADRMYAADMGGQLLRFDISNGESPANLVAGGVIAQLGAEGLGAPSIADTRRFYNSPDVSICTDGNQNKRFISLSIGSGYRSHPLDNGNADRFYSVRDPNVFGQLTQAAYNGLSVVTDADLVEVSGQVRTILDPTDRGWKFTMPADQKVLANSVTFNNSVFFVGFSPEANLADICQPSQGRNFLYKVSCDNGDPVVNNLDTLDPDDADAERMTELAQGGIAPSPVFLFPSPDDPDCTGADCAPPPIACIGVECFNPGFANNPVRTLWTQDGIE
ncbi:putative Tfp pilus assembly protein tip-associated adhesin PilY1-like protein [uncultured Woeseiaceae bacterium]|uniref:Putative Tfp pilus assembly protein tip-associated adhesin PilY1-like protein n=1 Tax=uncultured Woeseiaceae bacterium TaxID=1983305 RepID=A0A7D9H834_9GAMM|nr:putative Tfp pilus assembly protein tip-associated adhesin PilY1-like protein [uncultured Woeseiaceae bacterium]